MFEDVLPIPEFFMKELESGIIQYTYSYTVEDNRDIYNKVKTITTDIYWKNNRFHVMPGESFNSQTLEYLRDQIDQEKVDRQNQFQALADYVNKEYTNKLEDEIRRSTEVDAHFLEVINEVEAGLKEADEGIKAKLDEEIKRSTEVDIKMLELIKEVEASSSDTTKEVDGKVDNETDRATEKESELEDLINKEAKRAKEAEKSAEEQAQSGQASPENNENAPSAPAAPARPLAGGVAVGDRPEPPKELFSNIGGKALPKVADKKTKVGRNDPCPCGSGKKYKDCCYWNDHK